MFFFSHRSALLPVAGVLLLGAALGACSQLDDIEPPPAQAPQNAEAGGGAINNAARDLNFRDSDFPAGWEVSTAGDGEEWLRISASAPAPDGGLVSSSVRRSQDPDGALKALTESISSLAGKKTVEPVRLGERGFLTRGGDGWHVFFLFGNVMASVSATSGSDDGLSRAATLLWAGRLESRIAGRTEPDTIAPPVAIFATSTVAANAAVAPLTIIPAAVPAGDSAVIPTPAATPPVAIPADTSMSSLPTPVPAVSNTAIPDNGDAGAGAPPPAPPAIAPVPDNAAGSPPPAPPETASRPADLVLEAATPTPQLAQPGQRISWSVTVTNAGESAASRFTLTVLGRSGREGTEIPVQEIRMPGLAPGQSFTVVVARAAVPGEYLTFVAGDAVMPDGDQSNNSLTVALGDYMLPDLVVRDVQPGRRDALPGQTVEWTATVANLGPGDAHQPATVRLIDAVSGAGLAEATVPPLLRGEEAEISFPVVVSVDGMIRFTVSGPEKLVEADLDDNSGPVIPTRTALRPDLAIDSVISTPEHPAPGETVEWRVIIGNPGPGDSDGFSLRLRARPSGDEPGVTVHEVRLPGVNRGDTVETSFSRQAVAGEFLTFEIDYDGKAEAGLENNALTVGLDDLFLPDLEIVDATPNRTDVLSGEGFTWNLAVRNSGGGDPWRRTRIAMYDSATGAEIGSASASLLRAGQEEIVRINVPSAARDSLLFRIDPDRAIPEASEANNTISRDVADVLVHDLAIDWLIVDPAPGEDDLVSWRWSLTNAGPGRAREINIQISVTTPGDPPAALEPVLIAELDAGNTIQGGFKRPVAAGEHIAIIAWTDEQTEATPADNALEVDSDDFPG